MTRKIQSVNIIVHRQASKVKYKRRSSINDFTALVVNFVYIVIVILKYIGIHVNYQRGNTEREAIFENIVLI